ncbi:MAG: hypothetical protein LCI00_14185 [Chloroflexi bacterium]|nr:hypothetical protein [Chloroflexota bacterium]MCC6896839.1 hypothetical protein [Anaerolineae bacterium]
MPNNKMERFTQRARRVLSLAQEEAERLHDNTIDAHHILIGLVKEEGGVAGIVLRHLGVETAHLENTVEQITPPNLTGNPTRAELSNLSKRVLEMAVDEARRMGHHFIGTEHLLLALVRLPEGTAIDALKQLDITPEEVRRQTRRALQEASVQPSSTSSKESIPSIESRPQPNRPAQYISAGSMYLLESMTNKMLDMIGEGKLTVEQANEMLAKLQPGLSLNTGLQAWLKTVISDKSRHDQKQVRIVVSDVSKNEILFEFTVSLLEGLERLDQLLLATVPDNEIKGVAFDSLSSPIRVTVNVEKSEPQ